MRILITGSRGMVGRDTVRQLHADGHELVGLNRSRDTSACLHAHVEADLASTSWLEGVSTTVEPCDAIVHCAANLDMDLFAADVVAVNGMGTQQLLALARQWGVACFIFLSSVPVIGTPRELPITETHPLAPQTAYHASKLFGERLVDLASGPDLRSVSLRLTSPLGPGLPEQRIVSRFLQRGIEGAPIEIWGSGARRQNYVDTRDVAAAIAACLQNDASGVYNVAGATAVSNQDLGQICRDMTGARSDIVQVPADDADDALHWDVSIEKAATEWGYAPARESSKAVCVG